MVTIGGRTFSQEILTRIAEAVPAERYGVLMDSEREVVVTVKWTHPAETPALLEQLRGLPCGSLTGGDGVHRGLWGHAA